MKSVDEKIFKTLLVEAHVEAPIEDHIEDHVENPVENPVTADKALAEAQSRLSKEVSANVVSPSAGNASTEKERSESKAGLAGILWKGDRKARSDSECLAPDELDWKPYSQISLATSQRLKNSSKTIFTALLITLLGFKIVFGALALSTLLFWTAIIFLLTKLKLLSTRYICSIEEFGIVLSRRHWLGTDVLKLNWHQIESLAQISHGQPSSDELVIKLKDKALGPLRSLLFKDVFDSSNIIVIRPSPVQEAVPDSKQSASAAPVAQADQAPAAGLSVVPVADDGNPNSEHAFFRKLTQWCPAELLMVRKLSPLPAAAPESKQLLLKDEYGFVVPYLPIHQFQKKCSQILKSTDKLWMFALSVFLVVSLISFGAERLLSDLLGLYVPLLLLVVINTRETKYSLLFTHEGITIVWAAPGATHRSKPIPWSAIEFVSHNIQFGRNSTKQDLIEFRLNGADLQTRHLGMLKFIQDKSLSAGLIRQEGNRSILRLETSAIVDEQSKQDLLSAIKYFMPAEQIDASISELLNPTDLASYTQLWLNSLGNESTRRLDGKLSPGQILKNGTFEIIDFLGAGGQASVYLAKIRSVLSKESMDSVETIPELSNTQAIVLKEFILPSHAGADLSVRSMSNIQKELDLMKRLQHPNIVQYHDIFVEDHRCYLVLEHIDGKSLRTMVEESGPLCQDQVLALALQMAEILQFLHTQIPPIVHRDFTPENLILDQKGVLKLIDFNVAQELEERATRTIVGKHSYLPPEQFRGKACPQSDIYALGATLYFLLTGDEPEPITCLHPIVKDETLSSQVDALVAHATELELEQRFLNASDILKELAELSAALEKAEHC